MIWKESVLNFLNCRQFKGTCFPLLRFFIFNCSCFILKNNVLYWGVLRSYWFFYRFALRYWSLFLNASTHIFCEVKRMIRIEKNKNYRSKSIWKILILNKCLLKISIKKNSLNKNNIFLFTINFSIGLFDKIQNSFCKFSNFWILLFYEWV